MNVIIIIIIIIIIYYYCYYYLLLLLSLLLKILLFIIIKVSCQITQKGSTYIHGVKLDLTLIIFLPAYIFSDLQSRKT